MLVFKQYQQRLYQASIAWYSFSFWYIRSIQKYYIPKYQTKQLLRKRSIHDCHGNRYHCNLGDLYVYEKRRRIIKPVLLLQQQQQQRGYGNQFCYHQQELYYYYNQHRNYHPLLAKGEYRHYNGKHYCYFENNTRDLYHHQSNTTRDSWWKSSLTKTRYYNKYNLRSSDSRSFSLSFSPSYNNHNNKKRSFMTDNNNNSNNNSTIASSSNTTSGNDRGRGRGMSGYRGRGRGTRGRGRGGFNTLYNEYQNNHHYTPKTIIQTPRQVKEWASFNENNEKSSGSSLVNKQAPSQSYLTLSKEPSKTLTGPIDKKKLIILDLNGTLASRTSNRQSMYVRPYQDKFLDYIFKHFKVMVWSSAQPHSVTNMCQLFGDYEPDLLRMWDRRYFNLSLSNYNRKSQTLKDLEIVWRGLGDDNEFDATNTILIDDSPAKAIIQPYNSIHLREFNHTCPQFLKHGEDELLHVVQYLERLRTQSNVCNFISKEPFQSLDSTQNKVNGRDNEDDFKAYHYIFGQEGRRLHDFHPSKQKDKKEEGKEKKKEDDKYQEEIRKIEQQLESTKL